MTTFCLLNNVDHAGAEADGRVSMVCARDGIWEPVLLGVNVAVKIARALAANPNSARRTTVCVDPISVIDGKRV